jgi:hypothetical protein
MSSCQTFASIPHVVSLPSLLVGLETGFKVEKVPRLAAAFVMFAATPNATFRTQRQPPR